jgi:iron complex transport system substrate-binding protein
VLAVVVGVGLSLGVVACSSDDSSDAASSSDAQQSDLMPAAEGKTQYPLTLETPWGKTELKKRPERVMATTLSGFDAELLVALGVTPVAANMGIKNATYVRDAGGDKIGTTLDGTFDEMYPLEQMSALEPDLIVNFSSDLTDDYKNLSAIAPVVSAEQSMKEYYNQPWQDMIRTLGKALDLSDRADKIISDNENLLKKTRDEHPEFSGKTASFTIWRSGDLGLGGFKKGAPSEVFLQDIGFSEDALAERKPDGGTVSPEKYGIIDADALIVADSSNDDLATLTDNPLYKAVPAVKDGHVSYIARAEDKDKNSALAWAFALLGPIGTQYVVDNLVPKLDEALKAS